MLDQHRELVGHWCPISERFSGTDSLLSAINEGWRVLGTATRQTYRLGYRFCNVYTFMLTRDSIIHTMRVVEAPVLRQVIAMHHIRVLTPDQLPVFTSMRETVEAEAVGQEVETTEVRASG